MYTPTHEERIVALEQAAKASREFQQQVITKIREINENDAMLLGVASEQGIDIKRIKRRLDGIDTHLEGIDRRLDGIDTRLDRMDKRFDGIDTRLDRMDERFEAMDTRFDRMETALAQILERLPEKA